MFETLKRIINKKKGINKPPPPKILTENLSESDLTVLGVLDWINRMRNKNKLKSLIRDPLLDRIAQERLNDMFQKQYYKHVSPEGIGVLDIAKKNNYEFITVGENIALGDYANNEELVNDWMNSPGHQANILNISYAQIGIAVKKDNFENRRTWMAIQVFALPVSACPKIDAKLKQKIDANNSEINELNKSLRKIGNILNNSKSRSIRDINVFNENVRKYNELVSEINSLVNETRDYIKTYNAQVEAYNACASGRR